MAENVRQDAAVEEVMDVPRGEKQRSFLGEILASLDGELDRAPHLPRAPGPDDTAPDAGG